MTGLLRAVLDISWRALSAQIAVVDRDDGIEFRVSWISSAGPACGVPDRATLPPAEEEAHRR